MEEEEVDASFASQVNADGADASAENEAASAPLEDTPSLTAKQGKVRQTYELEMLGATIALVYVGLYFVGSSTNSSIAQDFLAMAKPTLASQFAEVGACGDDGSAYRRESANEFTLYASGRRGCEGMLVTLQLAPRQDLLSWLVSLVKPSSFTDSVVVEVPMTSMAPFVLGVLPARTAKTAHSDAADLRDLAKVIPKPAAITGVQATAEDLSSFTFVTDAPEVLSKILTAEFAQALAVHGPPPRGADKSSKKSKPGKPAPSQRTSLFQMAHFTDHALLGAPASMQLSDKVLRFKFKLPGPGQLLPSGQQASSRVEALLELKPLLLLACKCVDIVSRLNLSRKALAHSNALRASMAAAANKEAEEERAEKMRQAREEQARAEHERLVNMKDQRAAGKLMAKKQRKAVRNRMRKPRVMAKG